MGSLLVPRLVLTHTFRGSCLLRSPEGLERARVARFEPLEALLVLATGGFGLVSMCLLESSLAYRFRLPGFGELGVEMAGELTTRGTHRRGG